MGPNARKPFRVTSTLTRPANTSAYAQNNLIASSATAGSIVVPSFNLANLLDPECEHIEITRGTLYTNLVTGFTTFAGQIDLWNAAPTFTNGDRGAYAVATGMAGLVGRLATETSSAFKAGADGAALDCSPGAAYAAGYGGVPILLGRASLLYWSLYETDATGFTPASGQTFTLALQGYRH